MVNILCFSMLVQSGCFLNVDYYLRCLPMSNINTRGCVLRFPAHYLLKVVKKLIHLIFMRFFFVKIGNLLNIWRFVSFLCCLKNSFFSYQALPNNLLFEWYRFLSFNCKKQHTFFIKQLQLMTSSSTYTPNYCKNRILKKSGLCSLMFLNFSIVCNMGYIFYNLK